MYLLRRLEIRRLRNHSDGMISAAGLLARIYGEEARPYVEMIRREAQKFDELVLRMQREDLDREIQWDAFFEKGKVVIRRTLQGVQSHRTILESRDPRICALLWELSEPDTEERK